MEIDLEGVDWIQNRGQWHALSAVMSPTAGRISFNIRASLTITFEAHCSTERVSYVTSASTEGAGHTSGIADTAGD